MSAVIEVTEQYVHCPTCNTNTRVREKITYRGRMARVEQSCNACSTIVQILTRLGASASPSEREIHEQPKRTAFETAFLAHWDKLVPDMRALDAAIWHWNEDNEQSQDQDQDQEGDGEGEGEGQGGGTGEAEEQEPKQQEPSAMDKAIQQMRDRALKQMYEAMDKEVRGLREYQQQMEPPPQDEGLLGMQHGELMHYRVDEEALHYINQDLARALATGQRYKARVLDAQATWIRTGMPPLDVNISDFIRHHSEARATERRGGGGMIPELDIREGDTWVKDLTRQVLINQRTGQEMTYKLARELGIDRL